MDTKHEALELAEMLEQAQGNGSSRTPKVLRRQHARIEELERALEAIVEGHDMGGLMSDADAWKDARALLTKKD